VEFAESLDKPWPNKQQGIFFFLKAIECFALPKTLAMSPTPRGSSVSNLRSITNTIAAIPTDQLHRATPQLLRSLADCEEVLSSSLTGKKDDFDSVLVHKYKSQLSTLLQSRSERGRWVAIALIKSTVEIGGWEMLREAGPWVRGILGMLAVCTQMITSGFCYEH
jgi:hypothetical protein